jgi:hypothetical protein
VNNYATAGNIEKCQNVGYGIPTEARPIDDSRPNLALLRASLDAVTSKAGMIEESLREHALALTGGWPEPGENNAPSGQASCGEVEQLLRSLSRLEEVLDRIGMSTHQIGRIRG